MFRAAPLILALASLGACGEDRGSRDYDVTRYDLEGEYDWAHGRLVSTVRVTLATTVADVGALELDSAVDVRAVRIAGVGDVDFEVQPEARLWVSLDDVDAAPGAPIVLEIDYEAAPCDQLRPIPTRVGDPLPGRALFTDSEPNGTRRWMPSNDTPTDRALFSVAMRMDAGEAMIANGTLLSDATTGSSRRMHYDMPDPLPTYLMAFAISDFEVVSTKRGELPIEIWRRRGLEGDHEEMLAELSRMIGEMEALFGPYPFDRYALVLVPGRMSGGMENAGITFQGETSSTAPSLSGDLVLAAHELAHQWIGDLVTVKSWDDVWIKEGMATLLQHELTRAHLDRSGAMTLNGDAFFVRDDDAIRDTGKPPRQKYDSGPYGRAAWLFTQIRAIVGDEVFFSTFRGLVEEHRMGAIGTEDVIAAFGPLLGPLGAAKLEAAIDARALPRLELYASDALPSPVVTLRDPEGALLAPIDMAFVAPDGATRTISLVVDKPVSIEGAAGEFLVHDPADIHPPLETFIDPYDDVSDVLMALQAPRTSESFAQMLELPGIHQQRALEVMGGVSLPLLPEELLAFLGSLRSDRAQAVALHRACEWNELDPAWTGPIAQAFATYPPPFGLDAMYSYSTCKWAVDPAVQWPDEWQRLLDGLPEGGVSAPRAMLLSKFDGDIAHAIWPGVATNASTLRARRFATARLTKGGGGHAFFLDLVRGTEAVEVLREAMYDLGGSTRDAKTAWQSGDAGATIDYRAGLDAMREVLKKDVTRPVHAYTLCTVRNLHEDLEYVRDDVTGEVVGSRLVFDNAGWKHYLTTLADAPLSDMARAIAADPSVCD